jgi:hypothetical protein
MLPGQVGFDSPSISADHHFVGWLVLYPNPTDPNRPQDPLDGKLIIYKDGRHIRTVSTKQVFWDWRFQADGKRIAYSTGPLHGGAAVCLLLDVESGREIAKWLVIQDGTPPAWAASLRF